MGLPARSETARPERGAQMDCRDEGNGADAAGITLRDGRPATATPTAPWGAASETETADPGIGTLTT